MNPWSGPLAGDGYEKRWPNPDGYICGAIENRPVYTQCTYFKDAIHLCRVGYNSIADRSTVGGKCFSKIVILYE